MTKLKYYTIVLEGIDKCGKDTIGKYLFALDGGKYLHITRGIMSVIAYNKLYNRDFDYDLSDERRNVFVNLLCDEEDWKIRCKITNEPKIDYKQNCEAFEYAKNVLKEADCFVIDINTSEMSIYDAATMILNFMEELNEELFTSES